MERFFLFNNDLFDPTPGVLNKSSWFPLFISDLTSTIFFSKLFFSDSKTFLKLSFNLLNSNSSKTSSTKSISGLSSLNSPALKSTGTFNIIFANSFDNKPSSLLASIFSFNLPLILYVLFKRFSIEPYSAKNFFAVLSPTPGNPGILSTESPIIPK